MARFLFEAYPRGADANNDPASGAKLYVYEAGTTTPVTVYSDKAMTVAHAIPVVADASGAWPEIYAPDGQYKVVITNAYDVTLQTVDNVSQFAFIEGSERNVATLADLVADTEVAVGDYIRTLGYFSPGDGGGNLYQIVAASTGTADGGSYIDLTGISGQAKGIFGRTYRARQFGIPASGDASGALDAMNAAAVAAKSTTLEPVEIIIEGRLEIANAVTIGGAGENYVVHMENAFPTVIAGGDLEADSDQAAFTFQASTSTLYLGSMGAEHICGGYKFDGCVKARVYGGRVERFTYRAFETTGNCADMMHFGPSGNEWDIGETEFNTDSNFVSVGYYANANDVKVYGSNIGYCKYPIVFGPEAEQTFFHDAHPFNGNPNADDDAGLKREHPFCVQNLCPGNVYLIAPYIDNGYVDDQTGSLTIQGGRQFVSQARVTMTHPFTRVKMQGEPAEMDGTIIDYDGSIGFYTGTWADDFSNAVTDLVYTPSSMRDDGRRSQVGKRWTRLITSHSSGIDTDTVKQGDGTAKIVERYRAGTTNEVNLAYAGGVLTVYGSGTTGEVRVSNAVRSGMVGNGSRTDIYANGNLALTIRADGEIALQMLETYATNAAALSGGLAVNDIYKTATGELRVVV